MNFMTIEDVHSQSLRRVVYKADRIVRKSKGAYHKGIVERTP
jgi:hypothetical protein